jgi:stalled ribosome rescue protein Dom34
MPRKGRRGYPTAILIGLDNQSANIWLIYSESLKQGKTITKNADDEKSAYKHNEEIIEAIRTLLPEGFNQLIIASTEKYTRKSGFIEYLNRSHGWLTKKLAVKELDKKAVTRTDVLQLVKMNMIQESVNEAAVETNEMIIERLEKALNGGHTIYTLRELAGVLASDKRPNLVLIAESFDAANRSSRLYQSTIQKARNMGATVSIMKPDTAAGARLEQLGGFVCVIRR